MRTNVKNHSLCLTRDRGLANDNISELHLIFLKLAKILTFSPPKIWTFFPKSAQVRSCVPLPLTKGWVDGTGAIQILASPKNTMIPNPAKLNSELLIELKQ